MSHHIEITVKTAYLASQSDPDNAQFVFAYTITIKNCGNNSAKLLTRHWIITNADGEVQEVKGDGVIGQKPQLAPGDVFEYTSGAVLSTPIGCMEGRYQMIGDNDEKFEAEIPIFSLAMPDILH